MVDDAEEDVVVAEAEEEDVDIVDEEPEGDGEQYDDAEGGEEEAVESAPPAAQQEPPAAVPRQPRLPIQRQASTGVVPRGQFTPLAFGQPAGFEEGDDSIVPSTPTLFVPKRPDGFAEAVSSPAAPHPRFSFTAGTSAEAAVQPELGQLVAQPGAIGMDDTRVDIAQLESSARTTPTINIIDASPEDEAAPVELVETEEPQDLTMAASNVPQELPMSTAR